MKIYEYVMGIEKHFLSLNNAYIDDCVCISIYRSMIPAKVFRNSIHFLIIFLFLRCVRSQISFCAFMMASFCSNITPNVQFNSSCVKDKLTYMKEARRQNIITKICMFHTYVLCMYIYGWIGWWWWWWPEKKTKTSAQESLIVNSNSGIIAGNWILVHRPWNDNLCVRVRSWKNKEEENQSVQINLRNCRKKLHKCLYKYTRFKSMRL